MLVVVPLAFITV